MDDTRLAFTRRGYPDVDRKTCADCGTVYYSAGAHLERCPGPRKHQALGTLNADGPEEAEADPKISHDPTQRAEATTTPEGAKGWVDQAGSAQVLAGGHGLDVAPDASPGGSERRPASEQDGGGKPSSAPNAALNADGEATE